jgi:TM2 domain-containing membrane protein YozV
MSEAASWYYVGSFGQLGPLTLEQMEELIEGGVIEKSTYVWKPGMNDWLPAGNVTDLLKSFSLIEPFASPPPVPGNLPPTAQSMPTAVPGMNQPMGMPPMQTVSIQSYGHTRSLHLPRSDKSRTLSGILQLLFPGVGRMYMGYAALGVIQLVFAIGTCGLLHVWSMIDGILILSGKVRIDGYGRILED